MPSTPRRWAGCRYSSVFKRLREHGVPGEISQKVGFFNALMLTARLHHSSGHCMVTGVWMSWMSAPAMDSLLMSCILGVGSAHRCTCAAFIRTVVLHSIAYRSHASRRDCPQHPDVASLQSHTNMLPDRRLNHGLLSLRTSILLAHDCGN